MEIEWTEQALESFLSIRSRPFTSLETKEYKKRLLRKIEENVFLLGKSIPAEKEEWEGSYKMIIDIFIVYYSFSENQEVCYIEYFIHSSLHL